MTNTKRPGGAIRRAFSFARFVAVSGPMRVPIFLVMLFAIASGAPGTAQEKVEPDVCTPETAVQASIEAIKSDIGKWRGKCVAIDGVLWDRVLLADRDALRPQPLPEDGFPSDLIQLGYANLPRLDGAMKARAVGWVDDCGLLYEEAQVEVDRLNAEREAAGDRTRSIVFMRGLCHYTKDSYLEPVSITLTGLERLPRFTTSEIPEAERDLFEVSAYRRADYEEHIRLARAMVEVIADGNELAFYLLTDPQSRTSDFDISDIDPWAGYVLDRSNGWDAATIRKGEFSTKWYGSQAEDWLAAYDLQYIARTLRERGLDAPNIFVERAPGQRVAETRDEDLSDPEVAVCWCTSASCEDRWPATFGDTYVARERPYFCVRLGQYLDRRNDGPTISADPPSNEFGLAEPDWPGED